MAGIIDRGALHPLTLRFMDGELEGRFQTEEGAAGLPGYRVITGATVLLWAMAPFVFTSGTEVPSTVAFTIAGVMALAGAGCLAASGWATTMNRQHALASMLTSANGLVILLLADAAGVIEGYAVAAIILLFVYGFVSRTRFVYGVARTVVIAVGLGVAVATYDGEGSLLLDSFLFAAAGVGSLVGLRLIERSRRSEWHQRLVISEQSVALSAEKAESERLLLNVLPASISKRLKAGENPIADTYPEVSVVFADIVGFTPMASKLIANEVILMLSGLFSHFDDLVTERRLEKIKTIGDSYMAVGGLPDPLPSHAERVIGLALAMLESTGPNGRFPELSLRIGIHSGPAAGGVIGSRKFAFDVWGDTVNIAARLEQTGVAGRVHVSDQTRLLAGDIFAFEPRGPMELRGVGTMPTYLVIDPSSGELATPIQS